MRQRKARAIAIAAAQEAERAKLRILSAGVLLVALLSILLLTGGGG
jgi:hypothetical protein